MRRNQGMSILPVVALLVLLAAGGVNYKRNLDAESAVPRPYKGYSQADLESLLAAYEAENRMVEKQYGRARASLGQDRDAGMLDENIRAFENVQRQSSTARALGVKLSMQQTATDEIAAELERRKQEADVVQLHLRRLTTI